jgi:hypothetical protein
LSGVVAAGLVLAGVVTAGVVGVVAAVLGVGLALVGLGFAAVVTDGFVVAGFAALAAAEVSPLDAAAVALLADGADGTALDEAATAALDAGVVSREASTPVNVGAAVDPLTVAVFAVPPGVPPFDRPATRKITLTNAAMTTTMKITRRSQ